MELGARMVRAGEAAAAEAHGRHPEVAPVLLHHHVGGDLGGAEDRVHASRRYASTRRSPFAYVRVGVVPAGLELDQRDLVGRVAVDLVRRHEGERALRAVLPGRLEQVQGPERVHLEVVERAGCGEVVRGLRRAVDDEIHPVLGEEPFDRRAVADVEIAWCVNRCASRRAGARGSRSCPRPGRRSHGACCCRRRGRSTRARRGTRRTRSRSGRWSR